MRTLLDAITQEADENSNIGSLLDEVERESVGSISATDYIKWVQRSLNRLFGTGIPTDGKISTAYRAAVRRFNREYLRRDYDDVDEQTQNQLIYANQATRSYVLWVIYALNAAGLGPLPTAEKLTPAIVGALKTFQHSVGLNRDGFVGSKTELALIEATGRQPPGGQQPEPTVLPDQVFSLDPTLNWSNPGADELQNLLAECQTVISPVLPGADDRVPVANTRHLPFRWVCTIFSIFPAGLGNPRPQMARSSGFLLGNNNLITSAHVLYKYAKHDPGVLRIPDSVVFIPGFDPGETNSTPFGAFRVKRQSATGSARFFVPAEWINSIPPEGRVGEPKFDYGVIDTSSSGRLSPGEPADSWTSVSPLLASAAGREKSEPEEVGRLILSTRGEQFRTAGYPSDKPCIPMLADEFEFVGLDLPISAKHNVLLHRADTFFGTSGSPVWLERKVKGSRSDTRQTQKLLIGIVEGARVVGSGALLTYSTVITPKVFGRLTHRAFLSPV